MKWMKERDLLIAQTMAFVQSVTGKTPEAEKTVSASVAPALRRDIRNHPPGHSPFRRSPFRHCVAAGGNATRRPGANE